LTLFPETRDSLLVQVQNPANRDAWELFAQIYRPVIFRTARARGLQHADASDLSQQVLMAVASAIGDWEKRDESTRFRNWLGRVTRNAILNALMRRPKDRAAGGTSVGNGCWMLWTKMETQQP
jgi:RNA polymerase sigma-70 factor, ECF subfamily